MIQLVFSLRRTPGLSFQEFDAYWRDVHGPLIRSHAQLLGLRRYVQLPAGHDRVTEALTAARGGPSPLDGIAEAWYDSLNDLVERRDDPEVRRVAALIIEDEAKFIDLSASSLVLGEARVILEGNV